MDEKTRGANSLEDKKYADILSFLSHFLSEKQVKELLEKQRNGKERLEKERNNKEYSEKEQNDDSKSIELELVMEILWKLCSGIHETTVREIMTPRIDVIGLDIKYSFQEMIPILQKYPYSRFPVYKKSIDDIVGIFYTQNLFLEIPNFFEENGEKKEKKFEWQNLLREPIFIPETKKTISLLKEIQMRKNQLAVVVDEYGGVSGIVSLEDIMELIIGKIQDESIHKEDPYIHKLSSKVFLVDARSSLDEVNQNLNLQFQNEETDTIGGFVFNLLGHIPKEKEILQHEKAEFQILKMEDKRIHKIQISLL